MKLRNNKILLIIFLMLLSAFVLTRLFRSPARESNLNAEALKVDTSNVDKIQLYPSVDDHKEIKFTKDKTGWKVSREGIKGKANSDLVKTLLQKIAGLVPERIATRKEDKWNEYEVSDTTGTNVFVFAGNNERGKIKVGRESMGTTFVRREEEDEVYAVSESIASVVNRKFNEWRDPSFLRIAKQNITKIKFEYPADSGFVLAKSDKGWMINTTPADSSKIETYLGKIRHKDITDFKDDFSADNPPDVIMTIEGTPHYVVKGWKISVITWVLTSDLQPEVFFMDEGSRVVKEIFPSKKSLLK